MLFHYKILMSKRATYCLGLGSKKCPWRFLYPFPLIALVMAMGNQKDGKFQLD